MYILTLFPLSVKPQTNGSMPTVLPSRSGAEGLVLQSAFPPESEETPQDVGRQLRLPLWMAS